MRRSVKNCLASFAVIVLLGAGCTDDDSDSGTTASDDTVAADDTSETSAAAEQTAAPDSSAPSDSVEEVQSSESRLDTVQAEGVFRCGTRDDLPGFASLDASGEHVGFDSDFCRVIAAAVLGDANAVEMVDVATDDRFTALQSGEIDALVRNTTWTATRDGNEGATFLQTTFYDGQGMMVASDSGFTSTADMDDVIVCVAQGTTSELNLADYFRKLGKKYEAAAFGTSEEALKAYESGRCDAYTTNISALSAVRMKLQDVDSHVILPEVVSKEPLGPWVRSGDETWFNLVRWTVLALINAEELGITKANVQEMLKSPNPEVKRFLGLDGKMGEALGVTNDWVVRIISAVGNYGESFENHLGEGSRLKLDEWGLGERTVEINRRAAEIAREAAGPERFVAGSIGPTGFLPASDDPTLGDITFARLAEVFDEQAGAPASGKAPSCDST